jgi:hypothetical protein
MNAVGAALWERLTGSPGLTGLLATPTSVYQRRVPQRAAYPLVLFAKQSATDDNDTPHRARQLVYLVKGIVADADGASGATAGAIDDQIDAALHMQPLAVAGWTNVWLVRESDVDYEEDPAAAGGRRYWHAGGLYRIRLAR